MENSKENKQFESWEEVIKSYIDSLVDTDKKNEYLQEVIAHYYYQKIVSAKNESKDDREIENEIKKASNIKLTAKNKEKLQKVYLNFVQNKWVEDEKKFFDELEAKDNFYNIWISRACFSPEGIMPATHVAKLSHSGNSASSILDTITDIKEAYISTSTVDNKYIDGAYPDAKFSKIVKFFMLKYNSTILSNAITDYNSAVLGSFAENIEELDFWLVNFNRIINSKLSGSHLIKQIYYPIDQSYYCLLVILKSSTLLHHIYMHLFEKSIRKKSDKLIKAIRSKKYLQEANVVLPNISKILTTQSQPQNVSVLNGNRGGIIRLFNAQPPTWQAQLTPPMTKSLFDRLHNSSISTEIDYLRDFLLRFNNLDLSIKDPKRKRHLDRWVNNIIDELLFYVGSIQALPAGWSDTEGTKLKKAHQYLLDPYRQDDAFQQARQSTNWQSIVQADFANWLNRKLRGKDNQFTPQAEHIRLWKKLLEAPLREHMESVEFEVKQQHKEVV